MRIVFFGTPDFAVESLRTLVETGKNIVGVVTSPDRKAGRGQKVSQSAVKKYSESANLKVLQPSNLKDPNFLQELKSLKADLQIIVAFRMLPESVWNMPEKGTFNLHASLLPNYRGAAPINWAIINGEKVTGVTTFFLSHKIDTGRIIEQRKVEINKKDTAGDLHDKLMTVGAELVVKTVTDIEENSIRTIEQDLKGDYPTAPKIFKKDCRIDWKEKASSIDRLIRGMSPYPTAWTELKNKNGKTFSLKIFTTEITTLESEQNGKLEMIDGEVFINSDDFKIKILELQLEGKKRMLTKDFLNGININDYEIHS